MAFTAKYRTNRTATTFLTTVLQIWTDLCTTAKCARTHTYIHTTYTPKSITHLHRSQTYKQTQLINSKQKYSHSDTWLKNHS